MNYPQSILDEFKRVEVQRKTGTLCFTNDSHSVVVSYRDGLIAAVSSNLDSHRLGQYFIKNEYLDDRRLSTLIRHTRRKAIRIGEAAVSNGILDGIELGELVRRQAVQLIKTALDGQFRVQSFTGSSQSFYYSAGIGFEHLFLELARASAAHFNQDDRWVVINGERDLSHLPWYPEELFVLGELKAPHSVSSLCDATGLEINALRSMLNVFDCLGLLQTLNAAPQTALVKRTSFPIKQLIPEVTNPAVSEKLEAFRNQGSFISEQFKNLKVHITEAGSVKQLKTITISSAEVEDGKSLVSANLAFSFSMDSNRRVVIVDCDLRRPSLNKYLGVPLGPGLLNYLETGSLAPHCYIRRLQNLYFVTAGGIAEKPVELLSSARMKAFVEYLSSEFDIVILDAPPFAPISDARLISTLSDGLVMIVRMGKTAFSSLKNAFRVVDKNKVLGVVLNDVQAMPFHSHYGYSYSYGTYYSGYQVAEKTRARIPEKTYLES